MIELANIRWDKHERNGWGKPDKMIGPDIELFYLNRRPYDTILTFDQWKNK